MDDYSVNARSSSTGDPWYLRAIHCDTSVTAEELRNAFTSYHIWQMQEPTVSVQAAPARRSDEHALLSLAEAGSITQDFGWYIDEILDKTDCELTLKPLQFPVVEEHNEMLDGFLEEFEVV